jgi:hypothetical protein
MTRWRLILIVVSLWSPLVAAQPGVDFSGTWTLDPARSESALVPGPQPPVRSAVVTISQLPRQLRIDVNRDGVRQRVVFSRDTANELRPVGTSGQDGMGQIVSWNESELVTMRPLQINQMTVTVTEKRTLSADGREMTVETVTAVQHGYEGGNANTASAPSKDVYVRTP